MTLRSPASNTRTARTRLSWLAVSAVAGALTLTACGPTGTNGPADGQAPAAAAASTPAPQSTTSSAAPDAHSGLPSAKPVSGSGGSHSGSGSTGGSGGAPANAPQAVRDAFTQAKTDGKNVLLDFGATWCPSCRTVLSLYALPSVQAELSAHYHLVKIDISNNDKTNMALLGQYDKGPSYGLPVMIVVTPSGTMRVDTNKTGHPKLNESGMLDWLKKWAA